MKLVNVPVLDAMHPSSFFPESNVTKTFRLHHAQQKIALPTMDGIHFEKVQAIVSLEANGNYTRIIFQDERSVLVCKTLQSMEALISNPRQFIRIHRSFTINLNMLQKYVKGKGGHVVMENGSNITVSAGKKHGFLNALEKYFG
ncbi:MAG: LytTR family transcriptional regulator [Bacteroidetes bacterium]|nr:LytTR family transcriptional regulator [Bacteroidota bacterium]MDF1863935.1 LytTR family DNA-binding domain-containing protein [Saprospiraceae bacterium]